MDIAVLTVVCAVAYNAPPHWVAPEAIFYVHETCNRTPHLQRGR